VDTVSILAGTTFLLLAGVDPWVVMKQGRWSLKSFFQYWRKVENILPLFIGDALDSARFHSIKDTITCLAASG
jgi:hypothetical protein